MALFNKGELRRLAETNVTKSYGYVINESMKAADVLKKSAAKFSIAEKYNIFLSHSFLDSMDVLGIKLKLESMGYSVYVDWIEDEQLDRSQVDKETANLLRTRMKNCDCLFFATSNNAKESKWMPWELGYFDGINGKIVILPVLETASNRDLYEGQEYLGLYPYISENGVESEENKLILWVNNSEDTYVRFDAWLQGMKPTVRRI